MIKNIKTIRKNNPYTPKDVWVGLKKYIKRLEKYQCDNQMSSNKELVISTFRIFKFDLEKFKICEIVLYYYQY